jgi:hypothetical protein
MRSRFTGPRHAGAQYALANNVGHAVGGFISAREQPSAAGRNGIEAPVPADQTIS